MKMVSASLVPMPAWIKEAQANGEQVCANLIDNVWVWLTLTDDGWVVRDPQPSAEDEAS